VLSWLIYYEGPDAQGRRPAWWKNADGSLNASKIKAFIVQIEAGELWHVVPSLPAGQIDPVGLMAAIINKVVGNALRPGILAKYTAFFDPERGGGFTQGDWGRWLKEPLPVSQQYITNYTYDPGDVLFWWREGEIRRNKEDRRYTYVYLIPNASDDRNDEFYFGTREQFEYMGIGR
jgi:hypothetical protein